jgi:hypothetical protein
MVTYCKHKHGNLNKSVVIIGIIIVKPCKNAVLSCNIFLDTILVKSFIRNKIS